MKHLRFFIYIVGSIVVFAAQSASAATTIFMTAPTHSLAIGEAVTVTVFVGSDVSINAAQGELHFPASLFSVDSVTTNNSIFNIWLTQPTVNSSTQTISFLGASTNGFSGNTLPVFTVTLRARGNGQANLQVQDAAVTAADGTGSNVLSSSNPLALSVGKGGSLVATSTKTTTQSDVVSAPPPPKQITRPAVATTTLPIKPVVSVSLYPDQVKWYNSVGNFIAQWELPLDVSAVSTALDQNPQTVASSSEGLFDNKTFASLSEGIWYLHVRFKNSAGWGPSAHYRIAIDTTPPFPFTATLKDGATSEISSPTVLFETQDQPSGIAVYRIAVDGSEVGSVAAKNFTIPSLSFGAHSISVKATDQAGNVTESRISYTVVPPPFLTIGRVRITETVFFVIIISVITLGILVGWWLGVRARTQRRNRMIITQRDVAAAFGVLSKNLEKMAKTLKDGGLSSSKLEDLKFLVKQTKEQTEKMKRYVGQDIEEIES